jgi:hypothetical protein
MGYIKVVNISKGGYIIYNQYVGFFSRFCFQVVTNDNLPDINCKNPQIAGIAD